MDRRWTSHLKDPEEQKRFASHIKNSRSVLERQQDILVDLEIKLEAKELAENSYESPSWAFQQADNIGYRRALRDITRLITLDPKDTIKNG